MAEASQIRRKAFPMKILHRLAMTVTALLLATGTAQAQLSVDVTGEIDSNLRIAIPAMPTPQVASTPAGSTDVLGRQIAEVIASDLRGSGLRSEEHTSELQSLMRISYAV